MYKDFKLHFSKEIAISGKSLLFNTITIYPVKSSKEEFILFQLNENGDLFVADLSFGGKFETRGSHFTFMPVQYNDKPVSVSSVLEGPYRMIYLPQSGFLLILGSIIGVSGTASIEERFGIAKLSLSSPSITSSPSFFSLQGSPIEKVSLFHRVGFILYFNRKGTVWQALTLHFPPFFAILNTEKPPPKTREKEAFYGTTG